MRSNPLEAARRSRPSRETTVLGETYLIRQPSMADVRNFQAKKAEDARAAMADFLRECVASESGKFDLSEQDAQGLADLPWVSGPLLGKILRYGNGLPDEPTAEELNPPEEPAAPKA